MPRGWQRRALTGPQACWEVGPRGGGGVSCLKGTGGAVILLGKSGEDVSWRRRFTAMGGALMVMAGEGWDRVGATAGDGLGLFTSLGSALTILSGFSCAWLLFGIYVPWRCPLILIKACVNDRLVLDLRPALQTVST